MKTIPLDICGPSYQDYTLGTSHKRVNMYSQRCGKDWRMVSYPGLQLLATVPNNLPCRGAVFAPSQVVAVYSVNGNTIYKINPDGSLATTLTGVLLTSSGPVEMCSNKDYVMIVDSLYAYYITIGTNTVTQITDTNFLTFGSPYSCTFLNNRFIASFQSSGTFYLSQLDSPIAWTPIIFATADSKGDSINGLVSGGGRLHVLGGSSYDQFYPGLGNNPLEYVNGSTIELGADAGRSWQYFRSAVFFMSPGSSGQGAVWKISSGQIERISTPELEKLLFVNPVDSYRGFCYALEGQDFYELVSLLSQQSFCYNISSGTWFELQSNVSGYREHRLTIILNAYTSLGYKPIAFDKLNGNIYRVSRAYNSENTVAIKRIIDFSIDGMMDRTFHQRIRILLEIKHDTAGTYTLSAILNWSDDGGLTYNTGDTLTKDISSGTSAQKITLMSSNLGMTENERKYRLTLTGPDAAIIIRSADLLVDKGGF